MKRRGTRLDMPVNTTSPHKPPNRQFDRFPWLSSSQCTSKQFISIVLSNALTAPPRLNKPVMAANVIPSTPLGHTQAAYVYIALEQMAEATLFTILSENTNTLSSIPNSRLVPVTKSTSHKLQAITPMVHQRKMLCIGVSAIIPAYSIRPTPPQTVHAASITPRKLAEKWSSSTKYIRRGSEAIGMERREARTRTG
mmetsp:Transcript_4678/g.6620  ORF Transcript_4678/g.6620 Transcript_4678/m.6620 type:complete len:196 (+) Transcript_4678:389-976(+)